METQEQSIGGLRASKHAEKLAHDVSPRGDGDDGPSGAKQSQNEGDSSSSTSAGGSDAAMDEIVEGSAPHSNKEWGEQGETRKERVKLARRNSMIHQSAHELVLGKVEALLARASARFEEKHPKVAETLFIMRAYKRNMTDRTAFHRLT